MTFVDPRKPVNLTAHFSGCQGIDGVMADFPQVGVPPAPYLRRQCHASGEKDLDTLLNRKIGIRYDFAWIDVDVAEIDMVGRDIDTDQPPLDPVPDRTRTSS